MVPCFTFRLRRSPLPLRSVLDKRHWRLAPRTHTTLPSDVCESLRASTPCLTAAVRGFHSKLSCRAGRGSTTDESQDCSVPAALPQSCPKVFGLSAAYSRSPLRSGRCWTRATGTQQPSSYLGVIKCTYTGASLLDPVYAHLIAFIVKRRKGHDES